MDSKKYYELLGIPVDYSGDDFEAVVEHAYNQKLLEAIRTKDSFKDDDAYYDYLSQLEYARDAISNGKKKVAPVSPKKKEKKNTGAHNAKKTQSVVGRLVKGTLATAGIVAVIGGAVTLGWFANEHIDKYGKPSFGFVQQANETTGATESTEKAEETETIGSATEATEETEAPTEATEETKALEEVAPLVVNYGNISDEELVSKRATAIATQLREAGVINMNTGVPYTAEEIVRVTQFMCGAYIPENEGDAYAMVNEYLNFCLMDSELTIAFANVNGIDWDSIEDEAFKTALMETDLPNLQRLQETTPKINIVDNMLYGDVSIAAYNYLKMFETRYQEMIYSTDQAKCDDIYLDLTYSLTRLRVNGEYTFTWDNNEYTVTMNDFNGRDKVNAGNILQYYAFMYQTAFSKIGEAQINELGNSVYNGIDDPSQDEYTYTYIPGEIHGDTVEDSEHRIGYHDENISLDPNVNYADHKYLETTQYFNAICYSGLDLAEISVDDDGYLFLLGNQSELNFSTLNQINTINAALSNLYTNGLDYYNSTFNKTLTK